MPLDLQLSAFQDLSKPAVHHRGDLPAPLLKHHLGIVVEVLYFLDEFAPNLLAVGESPVYNCHVVIVLLNQAGKLGLDP